MSTVLSNDPDRYGAGGESSLTTLPQSSFATVATRQLGGQSLTLHRPQTHPTLNITPSTRSARNRSGRLLPPCVSAVHARNFPRGAALIQRRQARWRKLVARSLS